VTEPRAPIPVLPRIRQAVLAAGDLEAVTRQLRDELGLREPFSDPGVEYFGLRNAVFALGDTFLEVVSPIRDRTAAGRLLDQRGDCGYMVMFQVAELGEARARAAELGVREVFEVELDEIAEVHLHPKDIGGAIVSLSSPTPPTAWRWGGEGWARRSAPMAVTGVTIAASDTTGVAARWRAVLGADPGAAGVEFAAERGDRGLVEIRIAASERRDPLEIGGVHFRFLRAKGGGEPLGA